MFEREIKFIYDFNLNKVKQLGTHITLPGLKVASLHPAIIQYLSAEIDYLIFEDRQYLLQHSSFDYSGDEISKYFNLINEHIKNEKKLSFDYVDQLILQASSFNVNYLAQPAWSLSKLIFEKEENTTVNKAHQIINYVYYYEYLKNITEKYFKKKNLISVSKPEFDILLEKIDKEVFDKYPEKLLDKVLFAMADFFNIGSINKTHIPLSALELFLKEKKLDHYIDRIKDACYPDPKSSYNISEIRKILYSPVPVKKDRYLDRVIKQETPDSVFKTPANELLPKKPEGEDLNEKFADRITPESQQLLDSVAGMQSYLENKSREEKSEEQSTKEPDQKADADQNFPPISEEKKEEKVRDDKEDPGNLDLSDDYEEEIVLEESPEFAEENYDESSLIITTSDEENADADLISENKGEIVPGSSAEKKEDTFNQTIQDVTGSEKIEEPVNESVKDEDFEEPSARVRSKDISTFIPDKEMDRILTNVFNEDTDDFALTFERIADAENEEKAMSILDEVLSSNRMKPNSKEAMILRKIVNDYFNQ